MLLVKKLLGKILNQLSNMKGCNEPKTLYRPLSTHQNSNWTYTVPYTGILYLCFASFERTYCGILWNGVNIGDFALAGSDTEVITIPILVKKNDTIEVNNLSTKCWLAANRTCLIAWGGTA